MRAIARRNISKAKCACYAGGIGICLCIIFMSLGVIGVTAVGISKNGNMGGDMGSSMSGMTTITTNSALLVFQNMIMNFFSGLWGEVILLLSFVSMNAGLWFSHHKKVLPVSISGSVIVYISMYVYYSISLEIAGIVIVAFAYISVYSHNVAKVVKLA